MFPFRLLLASQSHSRLLIYYLFPVPQEPRKVKTKHFTRSTEQRHQREAERTMAGLVSVPNVDINFVPVKGGETFKLGPITCRVMEDGSNTGMPPSIHTPPWPPATKC